MAKLPRWASQPFSDFLDFNERLRINVQLTIRGISMITAVPNAVRVLNDTKTKKEEKLKLRTVNKLAKLAKNEIEEGFPLIISQSIVTLWSSLEALVLKFLAVLLSNDSKARENEELKKIKIRFGEYEALTDEEKCYYVLDLLEDQINSRRNLSIGRFESLMTVFGLTSKLENNIKKDLLELYHLRNVIVHTRGIADRRIVESCPWLNLSIGDKVKISPQQYERYNQSVVMYVTEIIQRVRVYFGLARHKFDSKELGEMERTIGE